jgi:hypothetical protein
MKATELTVGTEVKLRFGRNLYRVEQKQGKLIQLVCLTFLQQEDLGDLIRCSGEGDKLWVATFHAWNFVFPGCNYAAEDGHVCNKCGNVHKVSTKEISK